MFVLRSFFAAIGFLTILPVPPKFCGGEKELGTAAWFFPVIGLGIGAAAAYFDYGVGLLFQTPMLTSAITLVFLIAVSKALHLDGLADTADGFLSSRPRQRILEIMKDSHTGAMGVTAIVTVLMLKLAAMTALDETIRFEAIFFAPVAGRGALLIQKALLPYARPGGGLATVFMKKRTPIQLVFALLLMTGVGYWLMGYTGLLVAGTVLLLCLIFGLYIYRKIGGLTGDTLGAGTELAELGAFLGVVAFYGRFPWS